MFPKYRMPPSTCHMREGKTSLNATLTATSLASRSKVSKSMGNASELTEAVSPYKELPVSHIRQLRSNLLLVDDRNPADARHTAASQMCRRVCGDKRNRKTRQAHVCRPVVLPRLETLNDAHVVPFVIAIPSIQPKCSHDSDLTLDDVWTDMDVDDGRTLTFHPSFGDMNAEERPSEFDSRRLCQASKDVIEQQDLWPSDEDNGSPIDKKGRQHV